MICVSHLSLRSDDPHPPSPPPTLFPNGSRKYYVHKAHQLAMPTFYSNSVIFNLCFLSKYKFYLWGKSLQDTFEKYKKEKERKSGKSCAAKTGSGNDQGMGMTCRKILAVRKICQPNTPTQGSRSLFSAITVIMRNKKWTTFVQRRLFC